MKYLHSIFHLVIYFIVVYLCLSLFSTYSAFSAYKSEEVKNVQIKEADKNWVSSGTFVGGNGIVKSIFGDKSISFPLHCFQTAQMYFDTTVSFTSGFTVLFLIPVSIIIFVILKKKKFRFSYINIIIVGMISSIISFGALQVWLNTERKSQDKGIVKIVRPTCF